MTSHSTTGTTDPCACGVCGTDVPPLVGSILTGTGLTLDAAARKLEQGTPAPAAHGCAAADGRGACEARLAR